MVDISSLSRDISSESGVTSSDDDIVEIGIKDIHEVEEALTGTPSKSDKEKWSETDGGRPILIGDGYQASLPSFISNNVDLGSPDRAHAVWSPSQFHSKGLTDDLLTSYLELSQSYNYSVDQALLLLKLVDYDLKTAFFELENFEPERTHIWKESDRRIFEIGYTYLDRDFHQIHKILPNKCYAEIVEFYYYWKNRNNLQNSGGDDLKPLLENARITKLSPLLKSRKYRKALPKPGNLLESLTTQSKHDFGEESIDNFSKSDLKAVFKAPTHIARRRIAQLTIQLDNLTDHTVSSCKLLPPVSSCEKLPELSL